MMNVSSKVCAFCDKQIPSNHITCKEHWSLYQEHKDAPWVMVLVDAQAQQFCVDNLELEFEGKIAPKVKRQYHRLTDEEKRKIEEYRSKGLGSVNIAKLLFLNHRGVEHYICKIRKQEEKV
jgi:hypothetical protein